MQHPIDRIRLVPDSSLVKLDEMMKQDMLLKFPCAFENGRCDGMPVWGVSKPTCCCHSCVRQIGYLHFRTERTTEIYKAAWDPHLGFWSEDIGCKLDRRYRSATCVTYLCETHRSRKKNKEYTDYLWKLMRHLDSLRFMIVDGIK